MPVVAPTVPKVPVILPPKVAVAVGSTTLMVMVLVVPASSVALPLRVRPLGPSNVRLVAVLALMVFPRMLDAEVETSVVPLAKVRVPVPRGPLVTVAPTAEPTLLAAMISPPAVTFTPPANVFCELSCSNPEPVLLMPPLIMGTLMFSVACSGATFWLLATIEPMLNVLVLPLRLRRP